MLLGHYGNSILFWQWQHYLQSYWSNKLFCKFQISKLGLNFWVFLILTPRLNFPGKLKCSKKIEISDFQTRLNFWEFLIFTQRLNFSKKFNFLAQLAKKIEIWIFFQIRPELLGIFDFRPRAELFQKVQFSGAKLNFSKKFI